MCCKDEITILAKLINQDGPYGSILIAHRIEKWIATTKTLKLHNRCPYKASKCIDCPITCSLFSLKKRKHLQQLYL